MSRGRVPAPEIASPMYDIIEGKIKTTVDRISSEADQLAAEGIDESGVPAQAYVPNAEGQHQAIPSATQGYSTGPGSAAAAPMPPPAGVPGQSNKTVFDAGAQ